MTIEAELPRLAAGSTRDHVLLPNTALVDRVDLATPLSLSSRPATGLSALAPAQRAGAQRLCAVTQNGHPPSHAKPSHRPAYRGHASGCCIAMSSRDFRFSTRV